jgi:hypothetical protein
MFRPAAAEDPSSSTTTGRGPTARVVGFSSSSSSAFHATVTPQRPLENGDGFHTTEVVSDRSDTSSEDFHRYISVFGPAAAQPTTPEGAPQYQPHDNSWRRCVEPIDDYGRRVEPPTANPPASTPGWWSKVTTRSMELVSRLFVGPSEEHAVHTGEASPRRPFGDELPHSEWVAMAENPGKIPSSYIRHCFTREAAVDMMHDSSRNHQDHDDNGGDPYEQHHQAIWVDDDDMGMEMTLSQGINLYINNPNEYYGNIVSALLATRDPVANPVGSEDLQSTRGNPFLVTLILQSGALPVAYDSLIAKELQSYLDKVLVPPVRGGREVLPPDSFEYLKCLVSVPSQKITSKQATLFRRSGFEFASLLLDNPHLVAHLPQYAEHFWNLLGRTLDLPLAIGGLLLTCLDFLCISFVVQHWFIQAPSNGYGWITVICYVGGYAGDMAAHVFIMRKKARSVVYEGRVTPFPSVNLKLFPLVPVYEFFLLSSIIRHEWDARRHPSTSNSFAKGGNKHRAMIHDLYNTATIGRITHSVFYSLPHVLVQSYFFDWREINDVDPHYLWYRMLLGTSTSFVILALVLFTRQLVVFDSISFRGYASFATEGNDVAVRRSSVMPRTFAFALLYLFEINAFFVIIVALDMCNTDMVVWVVMSCAVVLSCLVIYASSSISETSVYRAVKWFIVPLGIETALTIFVSLREEDPNCPLFSRAANIYAIIGYVMWGLFGVLGSLWFVARFMCKSMFDFEDDVEELDEHPPMPGSATKPVE